MFKGVNVFISLIISNSLSNAVNFGLTTVLFDYTEIIKNEIQFNHSEKDFDLLRKNRSKFFFEFSNAEGLHKFLKSNNF